MRRIVYSVFLLLLIDPLLIADTFQPVGQFTYKMPDGNDISVDNPSDSVANFSAQQAIAGFERQNALQGLAGIQYVQKNSFNPISDALSAVQRAEIDFDPAGAKTAAANALSLWNQLNGRHDLVAIYGYLSHTGPNKAIGDLAIAFFAYAKQLQQSVNDAQAVPDLISAFIKSNQAGLNMLSTAQTHQGAAYGLGMHCNELILAAARQAGVPVVGSTTSAWFSSGMGSAFLQIYGGANGVALSQLVADEGSGKVTLPLGSVIITDGHAALFNGVANVNGQFQIDLYDANDSTGWSISLDGVPSTGSPSPGDLQYPGKQVGDHLTRLQWGNSHLVKVFQPLGQLPGLVYSLNQVSLPPSFTQGESFPASLNQKVPTCDPTPNHRYGLLNIPPCPEK